MKFGTTITIADIKNLLKEGPCSCLVFRSQVKTKNSTFMLARKRGACSRLLAGSNKKRFRRNTKEPRNTILFAPMKTHPHWIEYTYIRNSPVHIEEKKKDFLQIST